MNTAATEPATYSVTFTAASTAQANDNLATLAEQPCTLAEVCAACDEHNVIAALYDDTGLGRGFVRRGSYRLT